ncbi:hypothetical protein T484DRAFT_1979773 [Baffinella frigidus]|nr:hypothetical protein T484DRAFT_1979773 [Cryptophyta sp. CCMP2293]
MAITRYDNNPLWVAYAYVIPFLLLSSTASTSVPFSYLTSPHRRAFSSLSFPGFPGTFQASYPEMKCNLYQHRLDGHIIEGPDGR